MRIRRRQFLRGGLTASGLLVGSGWGELVTWGGAARVAPSNRVHVGLIGKGVMGSGHLQRLLGDPAFEVVGVCDVDGVRRAEALQIVEAQAASTPGRNRFSNCRGYRDYRELLAREDLDAVVVVTPDHWHALQSIDAVRAGKDVYCEKPVSVTIAEGRDLVRTVERYGAVFQTGTQYRSIPTIRQVCEFVRGGGLGHVKTVFTLLHTIGGWLRSERCRPYRQVLDPDVMGTSYTPESFALPVEPVPEGLDWDLWVGPAPWRPYNRLYHTNPAPGVVPWCFDAAFGVTSLTWFLAHAADVIQYALGTERGGPVEVLHPADGEFPTLTCRYANGTLLHFVDNWQMVKDVYHAVPVSARLAGNFGGVFVGERGWLTSMTTGGPIEGGPDEVFAELGLEMRDVNPGANDHHANWLACMGSRQKTRCDEELGHRTASLGHLINIACWTGRSLKWDPVREVFDNDDVANRLRSRATRAPWSI